MDIHKRKNRRSSIGTVTILTILTISLYADSGILTKIVDGDTLYFDKTTKCRIEYIDTPESRKGKKLKRDISKCRVSTKDMLSAGKSVTRYTNRIMQIGKRYEFTVSGKDRYKRSICTVKLNNSTFNEQMVKSGYATIYRQYMNKSELKHYEKLLQEAKSRKVGLWADRFEVIDCLDRARR